MFGKERKNVPKEQGESENKKSKEIEGQGNRQKAAKVFFDTF